MPIPWVLYPILQAPERGEQEPAACTAPSGLRTCPNVSLHPAGDKEVAVIWQG